MVKLWQTNKALYFGTEYSMSTIRGQSGSSNDQKTISQTNGEILTLSLRISKAIMKNAINSVVAETKDIDLF